MSGALYSKDILRLAASVPNLGRLDAPDGSAEAHSKICGSRVTADVKLNADHKISVLGLDVRACALGQASAALASARILGQSGDDVARARDAMSEFLAGHANVPNGFEALAPAQDYPARHPAILLIYDAIGAAVRKAENP
jgi:NifU-like protein involved in Fe-S cluster formation